jgi:hypothetical protein
MTPAPDFRALCAELAVELEDWMVATDHRPASSVELLTCTRAALATSPPEPPTPFIAFCAPPPEEVIRIDKDGFHYKGQFIADAGEAHRLMLAFLKQNTNTKPEPPEDDDRWPHL